MNILALAINHENWTADTIFHEQSAIKDYIEQCGGSFILYGPGFRYKHNKLPDIISELASEGIKVDAVICYISPLNIAKRKPLSNDVVQRYGITKEMQYFPLLMGEVNDIPKIFWANDFWQLAPEKWNQLLLGNHFNAVFSVYAPFHISQQVVKKTFSTELIDRIPFYHLPRALDAKLFPCRPDHEREWDVTLLGATDPSMYPSRFFFNETLKHQTGIRVLQKAHPGYGHSGQLKNGITGAAYREALSKSKIFAACGSKYGLPFIKMYEGLASGAVLLTSRINSAQLMGLIDGVHYVETTPQSFMRDVRELLENDILRQSISENARALFLEKHTVTRRAEELYMFFQKVITEFGKGEYSNDLSRCQLPAKQHTHSQAALTLAQKAKRETKKLLRSFTLTKVKPTALEENDNRVYSCLDWNYVTDCFHIFDLNINVSAKDLSLLAAYPKDPTKQKLCEQENRTSLFLRDLSSKLNSKVCVEIGTSAGLQAYLWAENLRECDAGRVYATSYTPHDKIQFERPYPATGQYSREEVLRDIDPEIGQRIELVNGGAREIGATFIDLEQKIDFVYLNEAHDYDDVIDAFEALSPQASERCVFVINNVDALHNGVERAVSEILLKHKLTCTLITTSPSFRNIAVVSRDCIGQKLK